MVFSSAIFLFIFLPVFLILYYVAGKAYRNLVALFASYLFYAWGEPVFALILLASSIFDYIISGRIYTASNSYSRQAYLLISLIVNFSLLGYFKYANFFVLEILKQAQSPTDQQADWSLVALPIGISFFTFQKASYIIDVYRRQVKPARSFIDFALYVALFPQLIAGPIVRYHDISKQLRERIYNSDKFLYGAYRFSIGLGKKVLIANQMAFVADLIFGQPIETLPMHYAWVGILAYTFQIYFDFSGYSDMAIGLGKMMGFTFLENFNRPYTSRSITEFWRRWHISLSNWMVEYLYVPLGGNRCKPWKVYLNLWVVFLLSGLWHGASWSFILWGSYHGFFLSLERIIGYKRLQKVPIFIAQPITFLVVAFGWVFFRIESTSDAFLFGGRLLHLPSWYQLNYELPYYEWLDARFIVIMLLSVFLSFNPIGRMRSQRELKPDCRYPGALRLAASLIVLLFCFSSLASSSYNPFIYFRF